MPSITCPACYRMLSTPEATCPQCGTKLSAAAAPGPALPTSLLPSALPPVGAELWTGHEGQLGSLGFYTVMVLLSPILFYVTIPLIIHRYLRVHGTEYRLTTEQLTITSGLWRRATTAIALSGIREIGLGRAWLPTRTGRGNVLVMLDEGTWHLLRAVPAAEQVRQLLQYLADARLLRGAVPMAADAPPAG